MAQVPALTTGDLPEEYRATFERITGAFSRNANLPPVYFNCPEIAQFIFGMGAEFREKEILPTRLVEIIVVTVSKINECPYCTVHHSNRAVELGMSAETLENILEPDPPGLDAKEKTCPRLCKPRSRAAMGHPRPSLCGYENAFQRPGNYRYHYAGEPRQYVQQDQHGITD